LVRVKGEDTSLCKESMDIIFENKKYAQGPSITY
jgi:hypothetical protein